MAKILIFFLSLPIFASSVTSTKGLEVATLVDKANSGFKGIKAQVEMELINAKGDKISREMRSYILENPEDGDKSIIIFDSPLDLKCTTMLTWSHKDRNDDQWLFLPSIKRIKRISPRGKSGSFIGSEFTYEDISSQELEEFTYKFVSENQSTWVVDQFPVDKNSFYSKQRVTISKKYKNPLKIEYFNLRNELYKTAEFSNFKKHEQFWWADEVVMSNHLSHKKSIMRWKSRKLFQTFSPKQFKKNHIKRCKI